MSGNDHGSAFPRLHFFSLIGDPHGDGDATIKRAFRARRRQAAFPPPPSFTFRGFGTVCDARPGLREDICVTLQLPVGCRLGFNAQNVSAWKRGRLELADLEKPENKLTINDENTVDSAWKLMFACCLLSCHVIRMGFGFSYPGSPVFPFPSPARKPHGSKPNPRITR